MTTKYTSGPWQAYNAINGRILARWHIKGSNHNSLASVHAQDSSEEEAGNAALLAAAPELAEALCDCIRELVAVQVIDDVLSESRGLPKLPEREALQNARQALRDAGLVS